MPSIIAEYLIELSKRTSASASGTYAYRGQENADWGVESGAYRRLENMSESFADEHFINYHEKMIIEPARMNGYGFKNGREVSDLELLAELQHYGAATCLIDFTRDFLVALWFACRAYKGEEKTEQDGKVFVLNTNDAQIFSSLEKDDMGNKIEAILNFQTRKKEKESEEATLHVQGPSYWYWSPHGMNQRILRQNSLFVFGKSKIADDHIIGKIQIQKQDKEKVLEELKILGITRESLFKDMPGFASSHGHNVPATPRHNPAVHYYSAGNEALQGNKPEKAKHLYSEAIRLNSEYAMAYFGRATAKVQLGDWDGAETDFSETISYKPDYANAYLNRAITRVALGRIEDALEDCTNAKKFGLHGPIVHRIHGGVKYFNGDYKGAEAELILAINGGLNGASIHYELGAVYAALHDKDKARQSFQLAKELAEKNNNSELVQKAEQQIAKLESVDNEG